MGGSPGGNSVVWLGAVWLTRPPSHARRTVLSRCRVAASDRPLHGGRPARVRPRSGTNDIRPTGARACPQPCGSRSSRERRSRLSADAGPQKPGRPKAVGQLLGHEVDELPSTNRHELGHATRDDGQILAALRLVPGQPPAVERPSAQGSRRERRAGARAGGGRREDERSRSASPRARRRLVEKGSGLLRRKRDDEGVARNALTVGEHRGVRRESRHPRAWAHLRPRLRQCPPCRVSVDRPERLDRKHEVAGTSPSEERRLHGEEGERGACLLALDVQGRTNEDIPECGRWPSATGRGDAGALRTTHRRGRPDRASPAAVRREPRPIGPAGSGADSGSSP